MSITGQNTAINIATISKSDLPKSASQSSYRVRPQANIITLFDQQVAKTPDAIALYRNDETLSFQAVKNKSENLAHALIDAGVTPRKKVGVYVNRSGDLPLAAMAIYKAGGVYVPLAADHPAERLEYMIDEAGIDHIIVLDGLELPKLNKQSPSIIRPEHVAPTTHPGSLPKLNLDEAAILFTSGSTGKPKGVELSHRNIIHMIYGHIEEQGLCAEDRILLSSSPGFILGFREIHLTFCTGAAHVALSRAELDDPDCVISQMEKHKVSVALFTPSYLKVLQGRLPKGLRLILSAGERPNIEDACHYANHLDYWNAHGATEVCGTYAMRRVNAHDEKPLPSGLPFPNTTILLLDENQTPCKEGEEGEIYVISDGLAQGYLNQPDLTAQTFLDTPWGRAFRTRDFGCWNDKGELIALGRSDDVVKINGQAVNLSEIEHALKTHDQVRHCVALLVNDRLSCAIETDLTPAPKTDYWREFLNERLPSIMIPAHVLCLDKMPISSAGKADRLQLSKLCDEDFNQGRKGSLPSGELENLLAKAWAKTLNLKTVFREDHFFSLGGTSLSAIQVSQFLRQEGYDLAPHSLLATPCLRDQAANLRLLKKNDHDDETSGLASAVQCDFWTAWKLGRAQAGAQISRVLIAKSDHSDEDWQQAWEQLNQRHAALRTEFFEAADEKIYWRVQDSATTDFTIQTAENDDLARHILDQQFAHPISLDQAPLVRAGIIRVQEGAKTLFWFALHHSVVDGLSAQVLQNELFDILCEHQLGPTGNGMARACHLEKDYYDSLDVEADKKYWHDVLNLALTSKDGEAYEDYALDKRRPIEPTTKAAPAFYERLSQSDVQTLEEIARKNGVGLHSLLLSLLAHETRRRTGKETVVIGSGITNQPAEDKSVVGLFVNLVPTVLDKPTRNCLPVDEFIHTQSRMGEVGLHARLPAKDITAAFRERHPDIRPMRPNLFDISFTANPSRYNHDAQSGLSLKPWRRSSDTLQPAAGLELAFHHELRDDGSLELGLVWNPDVYFEDTAQKWLAGFANWARYIAAEPTRATSPLPALLPDEKELLNRLENGPFIERPKKRFDELFSQLAKEDPMRSAVVSADRIITRHDLENEANRIANGLIDAGIEIGDVVAVLSGSNMSLPSVILGIWKCGATYLPLALDVPSERQAYIAHDANAHILIAVEGCDIPDSLANCMSKVLRPENLGNNVTPVCAPGPHDALAYIIYTSGTTGKPKGVLCKHDGMINAVMITDEAIGFTPDDKVAMAASPGFDASLWELGMGLLLGGALVPIDHALRDDPWSMKRYYQEVGVTIAFHAPSYVRISRDMPFGSLRVLLTGGEAPSHEDFAAHSHELKFYNAYGPTETTIIVCLTHIEPDTTTDRPLNLGNPGANEIITIRDEDGQPVPPGATGEVWLGGVGVGGGYLNKPDLTKDRFIPSDQGLLYKTGDLARWTPEGKLELAGRIDHQVKLHGQRLELEEIEQALVQLDEVKEAVLLLHEGAAKTKTLQAFVRLNDEQTMRDGADWRQALGEHLPPYMIPAGLNVVDHFPVTQSGKLDRRALLSQVNEQDQDSYKTQPLPGLETTVAEVWQDLLSVPVHREDNFFALGGNSLLAVTIAHRLSKQLNRKVAARDLFAAPTLSGFADKVANCSPLDQNAPERSNIATEGEREFWTAEQAGLDTRTFIILVQQDVHGTVPTAAQWDEAWDKLVARHGALRTYYREDGEGILRRRLVAKNETKLSHTVVANRQTLCETVRKWQSEPLEMAKPPLWRAGIISEKDTGTTTFWLALHHAVGDGRSVGVLLHDLAALLDGKELDDLATDLDETGAAYNAYLDGPDAEKDRSYWQEVMAPVSDASFDENPLDMSREDTPYIGTHRIKTYIDADTASGLYQIASDQNASMHALMLTLLALETKRRTGRDEFVLGTTASSRETAEDNEVVGCFVNMLPLPYVLDHNISFADLLSQTQTALMGALQHERFPFAKIYHDVWAERPHLRHPLRFPLFDFVVTENPAPEVIGGVFTRPAVVGAAMDYEFTDWPPGQDMVLIHERQPDGSLLMEWHVNAEVYTRSTSENWFSALADWARWLGENPQRSGNHLPALLPSEEALLKQYETGPVKPRPATTVLNLFEENAATTPNAVALRTLTKTVSYEALNAKANGIASALIKKGIQTNDVVAVLSDRSVDLAAAMLGVWKAGATYLPLAGDLPDHRLSDMAEDGAAKCLLVLDDQKVGPELSAQIKTVIDLDDITCAAPVGNIAPADTAYILFTSGSTGRPKGTKVGHKAYLNLVLSMVEEYELGPDDRTLMFSSPSFDVSLSDIGVPLAVGASLAPVPYEILSAPARLIDMINQLEITLVDITPTYLRLFDGANLPSVRILVTGGEAPFAQDVATYAKRHSYYNAYGPTENTITSCLSPLSGEEKDIFACGRPLANTVMEIRNDQGQRLPLGVMGEIWLGGDNLAEGYINRKVETAHAFIDTADGRRYRTGDLARWRCDGQMEILGRIDEQVKLNGIRVEISEIETVISAHSKISQAAVIVDRSQERSHKLYAFVRPENGCDDTDKIDWQAYLSDKLPSYMIPAAVIRVDEIPLTHAGKIDKKTLLTHHKPEQDNQGKTAPIDPMDQLVGEVWQQHLSCDAIYLEDNFFSLGGHSLLAIAVANDLENRLGHPVPARELFTMPTLSGFSQRVREAALENQQGDDLSDLATEGQKEFWVAEKAGFDTRGFNLALTLRATGNVPEAKNWSKAWQQVVKRHSALNCAFDEDDQGHLRTKAIDDESNLFEVSHQHDEDGARKYILAQQSKSLSMADGPLWRVGLVMIENGDYVFWLSLHHAIGDGWSLGVLAQDLEAALNGHPMGDMQHPYEKTAAAEQTYLQSKDYQIDQKFWINQLENLNASDNAFEDWDLDHTRPSARSQDQSKGSHCLRLRLDANVVDGLQSLAQNNHASFHALMLSLMGMEIQRRSKRNDFALGTVASRRESTFEANAVGYHINMLPVTCHIDPKASINDILAAMQQNLAMGLKHQRYPFAQIARDLSKLLERPRHPARMPVFDFAVTENPAVIAGNGPADWSLNPFQRVDLLDTIQYEHRPAGPAQDMVLIHEARTDGTRDLILFVNANIYDRDTAENWLTSLVDWAKALGRQEISTTSALPSLTAQEKKWLNQRHGEELIWQAETVTDCFAKQVALHANRPAIITDQGDISYKQVDELTDILARHLVQQGVKKGDVVAVLSERSQNLPQTALAIWKAGGVYMPISTSLPEDRMAFMCNDAKPVLLVAIDEHRVPAKLSDLALLRPENCTSDIKADLPVITPEDNAYILYTSGSTGTPKGVVIPHQGWNNFANGIAHMLGIDETDRFLLSASPSFDAWNSDVGMCWTQGAAFYAITREEMNDIAGVKASIDKYKLTRTTLPPSYLRLFDQCDFPTLRSIMTVGEPPIMADVAYYADKLTYVNGYGPTENSGATSIGLLEANIQRLHAGRAMPNVDIHILDDNMQPVPPGAKGLIWTGGKSLGVGYLNLPDKTDEVFVETEAFGRLYNTGDLGRWNAEGLLEIHGRLDSQVKLRGQRVELGEIEAKIEKHPSIKQAVALVETKIDTTQTLWAFATYKTGAVEPSQADWHDRLSEDLPSYMIPSAIIAVDEIPMGISGKIDQKALLKQVEGLNELNDQFDEINRTLPATDTEIHIAKLWEDQFAGRKIAREDDFFALGGDSLKVITLINALRSDYECSVNDLYENPTLAEFARCCKRRAEHLSHVLHKARDHWQDYRDHLDEYNKAFHQSLDDEIKDYHQKNKFYDGKDLTTSRSYKHILLTGATGYLGAYLLAEFLSDPSQKVTCLVRGESDKAALERIKLVLALYFGDDQTTRLCDGDRLSVLRCDLRHKNLGLAKADYDHLAQTVDAIYHSAANVNHFGHYHELYADNVSATDHLLDLAAYRANDPADFHHISTISVAGTPPEDGFTLFSEYSPAPELEAENYYTRTKQEAERRVIKARGRLKNATIHRVGNIVFAADTPILQKGVKTNAFFRQLASFIQVGKAPDDLHVWLCHVDYLAKALVLISKSKALVNETHHLEHHYRHTISGLLTDEDVGLGMVEECDFGEFMDRLIELVDQDDYHEALSELVEAFGLMRGQAPQPRGRRLEVITERTQDLLTRLGFSWPEVPAHGLRHLLNNAQDHFSADPSERT